MPAHEKLNGVQFVYSLGETGGRRGLHNIKAVVGDQNVGSMSWGPRMIRGISVIPEYRRQGIASRMWEEGHRVASENARIPKPAHSNDRTNEGDAWARSVGGRLPRRKN